jgi:hypothetical protein
MTENAISAFEIVKEKVAHHTSRVIMNDHDPLILYTDASTKAIGGVLMQIQGGREKPCISSHIGYQSKQLCGGVIVTKPEQCSASLLELNNDSIE